MSYYDRIDDYNYYNDHRTNAANNRWWKSLDKHRSVATVNLYDPDTEEEFEAEFPIEYEVCPTCSGKGTHVNPSIDCGGLTARDFEDDPGFRENYFSGMYDQPCNECRGDNVVPVIVKFLNSEQERNYKLFTKSRREDAEYEALCKQERMMGC